MRRVLAKKGYLTCWECGSSDVRLTVNDPKDTEYIYYVRCMDCGNTSLPETTEKKAIAGWNKAYTTKAEEPE